MAPKRMAPKRRGRPGFPDRPLSCRFAMLLGARLELDGEVERLPFLHVEVDLLRLAARSHDRQLVRPGRQVEARTARDVAAGAEEAAVQVDRRVARLDVQT